MSTKSILGVTAKGALQAEELEVWELETVTEVSYETKEFSALCPVTLQPDIYTLTISYTAAKTFESKGMKHYLWGFRDKGISCEGLAQLIAKELTEQLGSPVTASLVQQPRGGLVLRGEVTGSVSE